MRELHTRNTCCVKEVKEEVQSNYGSKQWAVSPTVLPRLFPNRESRLQLGEWGTAVHTQRAPESW